MQQVITISAAGIMSGLHRKRGQGVDLRRFGEASVTRASLIEFDEDNQQFYVKVLQPAVVEHMTGQIGTAHLGATLRASQFVSAVGALPTVPHVVMDARPPLTQDWLYFDDYDDAVRVEIAYLDALRLRGIH